MNGKLEYEYLPFFHDKVTGKESYDLRELIRAIKCPEDITVDTNTKSGFAEIDVRQPDFGHYYPITEE